MTNEQENTKQEEQNTTEEVVETTEDQATDNVEEAEANDSQLLSEVDQWKAQAEENYQRLLRTQADFDNFRKRTRLEKEEAAKYASLKVIESLLPTLDNFERALSVDKESVSVETLIQGVEMVFRQIKQTLENEGLQELNSVGEPFNPEFHQAVMQVESDEHESGIVIEAFQKGYKLKDKVIRPAMVKVSQ